MQCPSISSIFVVFLFFFARFINYVNVSFIFMFTNNNTLYKVKIDYVISFKTIFILYNLRWFSMPYKAEIHTGKSLRSYLNVF